MFFGGVRDAVRDNNDFTSFKDKRAAAPQLNFQANGQNNSRDLCYIDCGSKAN